MEEENNEKVVKKSKKKIVITIIAIVVIVFLAAGGFIFYHGNQVAKLIAEVNKISSVQIIDSSGNLIEEPIDMEIKTTGSYAIVEKTLKDYMNEIIIGTQELATNFDENKIMNLVSIDNIKQDGPDFINTKEEITKMKESAERYVNKMEELANEENLLSKIDDKNVGEYYKELYRQLAIDEESGASMRAAVEELKVAQEEAKTALGDLESIFNFLSDNKNEWQIQDEQIMFTTQSAYDEYTNLMASLETMQ